MREPVKEPTVRQAPNMLSPGPKETELQAEDRALSSAYRRWRNFANQCPSIGSPPGRALKAPGD
jgi:hypothetical protein